MARLHDPVVVATVSRAHVVLSVIKGRRPYRWTIWIYSIVRLTTLMAVMIELVTLVIATPINCKVWTIFHFAFAYMTFSFSSLLIVIRIIAIWKKKRLVAAVALAVWLTSASFLIHGITRIHAEWAPLSLTCGPPNTQSNKSAITAMLVTDIALLLIMLVGLLWLRHSGGGRFDLGRLLWKQGVMYLFIATIAEITPVVSIILDLNAAFDLMFLMPSLITMSIAATRMYRSLADFMSHADIGNGSDNPPKIDCILSNVRWSTTIPLPQNRMEVAVNIAHEHWQSSASQTGHYIPYMSSDGQLGDKPHSLDMVNDVESSAVSE